MIPLQRLPFLAGREVIKCLDAQSMFALSQTSKKGKALLKSLLPSYRLRVEFLVSVTRVEFVVNGPKYEKIAVFEMFPVMGNQAAKGFIKFFIDLFSKPVVAMTIRGVAGEFALELIRMVKQLPCLFYELDFNDVYTPRILVYTPRISKQILDECTDLQELSLENLYVSDVFKYVPPSPDSFKLQKLKGIDISWIKLEDFMQCKRITLSDEGGAPSAQCLINFFKRWMNSECALEFLEQQSFETDTRQLLIEELGNMKNFRKIKREGNEQCFEIERKDGKKAVITVSEEDEMEGIVFGYHMEMKTKL